MGRPVEVARVVRPHGIRGDAIVRRFGDAAEILEPGARLRVGTDGPILRVAASRPHQQFWIVSFEGVKDRTAAEALTGAILTVDAETLPALPEGVYYNFQLIGLRVRTQEGEALGVLEEVLETGAQDVYVVRGGGREILLPALRDVIREVDLAAGEMTVTPLPGLLDQEPPARAKGLGSRREGGRGKETG